MPLIGSNVKVEVQASLATALAISGISNATEGVVSYTGTDPVAGDVVTLVTDGMSQLNGQAIRVKSVNTTADTFVMEGMDTTDFGTFVATGTNTAAVVATWSTFSPATALSINEQTVEKLDATTMIDVQKKTLLGQLSAVEGAFNALFEIGDAASTILRNSTKSKASVAFRVTFAGPKYMIFNAQVAMGDGMQMDQGGIAKTTCSFTILGWKVAYYAT